MGWIVFYGMFQGAELETQMTSVERAVEYTDIHCETEAGLVLQDWPKLGEITYKNVSLSINNSKSLLLKNINFTIKSNEKIGIVGRTGAGKSSLHFSVCMKPKAKF